MKYAHELKRGDVLEQDGFTFKIEAAAPLPDGQTTVIFEDILLSEKEKLRAFSNLKKRLCGTQDEEPPEPAPEPETEQMGGYVDYAQKWRPLLLPDLMADLEKALKNVQQIIKPPTIIMGRDAFRRFGGYVPLLDLSYFDLGDGFMLSGYGLFAGDEIIALEKNLNEIVVGLCADALVVFDAPDSPPPEKPKRKTYPCPYAADRRPVKDLRPAKRFAPYQKKRPQARSTIRQHRNRRRE